MPIGSNKVVSIHYTLKDESGNLLDSTIGSQPFSYLTGYDQIIPKLEEEIDTMLIGGKKNVLITAEDAYGEYRDDLVHLVKNPISLMMWKLKLGCSLLPVPQMEHKCHLLLKKSMVMMLK